jgi:hypothetical protein
VGLGEAMEKVRQKKEKRKEANDLKIRKISWPFSFSLFCQLTFSISFAHFWFFTGFHLVCFYFHTRSANQILKPVNQKPKVGHVFFPNIKKDNTLNRFFLVSKKEEEPAHRPWAKMEEEIVCNRW